MVTSRDVARLAGVSQATVSRAMLTPSSLAEPTLRKVEAAMAQLGYAPHAGAQLMRTRRSNSIGVVVDDLNNPFYSEVLDELSRFFNAEGLRVVVWNAGSGVHADALKAITEYAVDGVVFTTATAESVELEAAVAKGRPLVLINRDVPGVACDKVLSDNLDGGARIADYLVEHGRFDVAYVSGNPAASTSRDRQAGLMNRLSELGHEVRPGRVRQGNFSHDDTLEIARRLLSGADRPDAIVCANDLMAFGVLDAMRELGRTPQDCWVIGYDDIQMAGWRSFDLTTVRQPSRAMAKAGAELLLARIRDGGAEMKRVVFSCELIRRGSTPE